jgi:hypothetical protein
MVNSTGKYCRNITCEQRGFPQIHKRVQETFPFSHHFPRCIISVSCLWFTLSSRQLEVRHSLCAYEFVVVRMSGPRTQCHSVLKYLLILIGSRGSSVSIVSGYGQDDRAIGVRSPARERDFSFNLCPDRLWGPPILSNGYRGPFPEGKARPGRDTDHSPRSWMSRSYTSFPPCVSIGVLWDCFTFIYFNLYIPGQQAGRQKTLGRMVASIPECIQLLIPSWLQLWSVSVVPKYFNVGTDSKKVKSVQCQ